MKRKILTWELAAIIGIAVIQSWLLFFQPVIGMADNGDFLRIMKTVGLDYIDTTLSYSDKYFGWFIRELAMKGMGLGGYVSTSLVPVTLAKGLSWLFNGGIFDMRFLAVLYMLLFMAGAWLLLRYNRQKSPLVKGLMAVLFVIIFADIGYSAYFNSLYSEPMALVSMLLTLGFVTALLKRAQPMPLYLAGFVVSAVFLVGSKVQNAPVGILLALLCLRLALLKKGGSWRRYTAAFAVLLVLVSVGIYKSLPYEIRIINQYQTVFYGVLKDSPAPVEDLRELGLPEKLAINAGTNYFEEAPLDQHDPVFAEEYYPRFSHMKVALFYLKHPQRFYQKLEVAAENGMTLQPTYLGNFEKSEGLEPGALSSEFSLWSQFKHNVLPNKLWFIAGVFLAYFLVLIRSYLDAFRIRDRIYLEVLAGIGLVGLFQFVTPIIGDGEADLGKHLFGFNVAFDLMLWISAVWAGNKLWALLSAKGNASPSRPSQAG